MAGARRVPVTLRPPDCALRPRRARRGRHPAARGCVLLNSPHNPTGRVLDARRAGGDRGRCAVEHDLIAITDEVYEHLVFDGEHVPLATLPGMAERTLTISSLGQDVLGHRAGRSAGRAGPRRAGRRGARGQAVPDLRRRHAVPARRRGRAGLDDGSYARPRRRAAGQARPPVRRAARRRASRCSGRPGTYFVNADVRRSARRRRRVLPRAARARGRRRDPDERSSTTTRSAGRTLVRFAFCKRDEVIDEAARAAGEAGAC